MENERNCYRRRTHFVTLVKLKIKTLENNTKKVQIERDKTKEKP